MTKEQAKDYSNKIAEALESKKGHDVMVIDVEKVTPHFDFLVIASAESFPHLSALASFVAKKLSEYNIKKRSSIKDYHENPWILVDCGFMVIHLFTNEARDFYDLEKLWVEGDVIYGTPRYQYKVLV
jgi:ribosome-associated protein